MRHLNRSPLEKLGNQVAQLFQSTQQGLWLAAGLLILGLLAGCAAPPPAPTPTPSLAPTRPRPTATATMTVEPFILRPSSTPLPPATLPSVDLVHSFGTPIPDDLNPLTGLRVENAAILNRRPMVIKVTNFPRSVRPQWGLSRADNVFEYYLEDELTRFVGIFYGNDVSRVGPIRSARPFDEYLLRMYKGLLVFGYADDRVIDTWVASDLAPYLVIEKPDNCPPMCRIGSENNYNTLFTDTAQLSAYVTARGTSNDRQPLEGLRFGAQSSGGQENLRLEIRFSAMSYHYWEYDPRQGRYLRWQDGDRRPVGEETYEPLFDSLNNEQIAADNVVVLKLHTDYYFLSSSTEIYTHKLLGSGEGYALRNGRIYPITWHREGAGDMLSLSFPEGGAFPLQPGTTWFEVINQLSQTQVKDKTWSFDFGEPALPTVTPVTPPAP